MNYSIQTYQDGQQLLGSDFTTIVKDCKSLRKVNNAVAKHKARIESLKGIKTFLNKGYEVKTVKY